MELQALTAEQQSVVAAVIDRQQSVFVTGRAGTGKSTLLSYLVRSIEGSVAVCAPTGVAALNVGGQTIHSLFGFRIGVLEANSVARNLREPAKKVLAGIDVLVVDEVSMASADVIDAMDRALRIARRRPRLPFGGAQIVLFGDPYQLSPVAPKSEDERAFYRENYDSQWFFDANVWKEFPLSVYELTDIHRQRDDGFKQLLNRVRDGSVPDHWIARLNEIGVRPAPESGVITLATRNDSVNRTNSLALERLAGRAEIARADIEGEFGTVFPAEPELTLKKDAQVMFLRNDPDGRWVNGTIGRVVSILRGKVVVEVDGHDLEVEPTTWQKYEYTYDQAAKTIEPEEVGEFTQFPLRLAWAVTIHKSQGQTYDRATIDLGSGAFSAGQTYVALSRLTSLDGLYLARAVRRSDIKVDRRVLTFMDRAAPLF